MGKLSACHADHYCNWYCHHNNSCSYGSGKRSPVQFGVPIFNFNCPIHLHWKVRNQMVFSDMIVLFFFWEITLGSLGISILMNTTWKCSYLHEINASMGSSWLSVLDIANLIEISFNWFCRKLLLYVDIYAAYRYMNIWEGLGTQFFLTFS